MRLFHASWDIPNVLLGIALYYPGAWLLRRALRLVMPGLVSEASTTPSVAPLPSPQPSLPTWLSVGMGIALVAAAVGAVFGAVAFGSWSIQEQRRAPAPGFDVGRTGTPPASPWVELRGWLQERLAARYLSVVAPTRVTARTAGGMQATEHAYTPVTSAQWRPGEPVSFFLEENAEEPDSGGFLLGRTTRWLPGQDPASLLRAVGTEASAAPPASTSNVRLRANDLPYFVQDAYQRAGMRLTSPYWVAYTDADARPFAVALLLGLAFVLGLPFLASRLARRARRTRAD